MDTTIGPTTLANEAVAVACKQLEAGIKGRSPRFIDIKKNEDMYQGVTGSALKGRNNVPFDCLVMGGFIDTLRAETDELITIKYQPGREQDKMAADKMSAVFEREMGPDKEALEDKMMDTRFLGALSGRMFMKLFVESAPKFRTDLSVVDHWDMVTEVRGGADLDKHLYKFQMNIFRTKQDLLDGVAGDFYDKAQVRQLVNRYTNADYFKENEDIASSKTSRWQAFGVDSALDSYIGTQLYRLVEGAMNYNGKWYYILFSYETKTWIRFAPLEEVFAHAKEYPGRGPWISAATHRHPSLFWTKAPADDIRPIGYTMKKIVNLMLDNVEKQNWGQRAYDPKVFQDPAGLLWKQDGLVRANLRPGQDISKGIFEFRTPDTAGLTVNLTSWLDQFAGQKSGITGDAQGNASTERATISINNLAQTSKRMTLQNKMVKKMCVDLGVIFDYGAYEHLREPYAVKLIGNEGARWEEEVTRSDTEKEFTVAVTSSLDENLKNNPDMIAERQKGFMSIESNPLLFKSVNASWYLREKFKNMGYNDEQIRVALDAQSDATEEVMAHAAQAIQDCLEGKEYLSLYRAATMGFIQKIVNFAQDKFPLLPPEELAKMRPSERLRYKKDMAKFDKLLAYANSHMPIAEENMKRKFVAQQASGAFAPAAPTAPVRAPAEAPVQ